MKNLIFLIFGIILLISCGTTKKIPKEKIEFLKAYAKTTSDKKITIYYKSIDENSNFLENWMGIIENMRVLHHFSYQIMEQHKQTIDSLTSIKAYSIQQKDSIIEAVVKRTEIKPWTLLSPEDKKYMINQVKNYETTKWTKLKVYFNLTKSKDARRISLPFISKDGKYALVFISDPGYRGLQFFKKENGEWVFYFFSTLMIV